MSKVTPIVGMVQINNSFSGQNYFPYSVGLLDAYARCKLPDYDRFEILLPIYKRKPVQECIEDLLSADLVFFSVYVWNFRISNEIAKGLKRLNSDILIVYGGPHVPDRSENFLRENRFVDLAVRGEGEIVYKEILENYKNRSWESIQSLSYLDSNGFLVENPKRSRIRNIEDEVPSPYLNGFFDRLIEANPEERWLGMWETNRGCPFSCTYCDWGSATQSKVNEFGLERLYKEVDWFARNKVEFIFCADANFGIKKRDKDIALYVGETKKNTGYPHALSVQNTKNSNDRTFEIQKILEDYGLNKGVTLSAQTMDSSTLDNIRRKNIPAKNYQYLQSKFAEAKITTYADLILGLPGETYQSFLDGICQIIDNGQHNRIQFNNLTILPNAEMGDPAYIKKYGIKTIENRIVNIHGHLTFEEVYETQQMVVSTNSMPAEDWRRTRVLSWMVAFLYFDKIMQIPLLVLGKHYGVGLKDLFGLFIEPNEERPTLNWMYNFFRDEAEKLQAGGPEFHHSSDWLNIWWPHDEYMFIKVVKEKYLDRIYKEAKDEVESLLRSRAVDYSKKLVEDTFSLNHDLIKLPFKTKDSNVTYSYNIWEYYRSLLVGKDIKLVEKPSTYLIDRTTEKWLTWNDWYKKVVWYGNKKGAYLYSAVGEPTKPNEVGIAAHY